MHVNGVGAQHMYSLKHYDHLRCDHKCRVVNGTSGNKGSKLYLLWCDKDQEPTAWYFMGLKNSELDTIWLGA